MSRLRRYLPIMQWLPGYGRDTLVNDLLAALIVTVLLIPQSLAYAMLAGLPAQVGLYASIAPLLVYAVFGTSRTLSVGPVAIIALMTATVAGQVAGQGDLAYQGVVLVLAMLSGLILVVMGIARLGLLANFLSHPVISGFMTASAIIIAASQLKHLLGIEASGHTLLDLTHGLISNLPNVHWRTLSLGAGTLLFLYAARRWLRSGLARLGIPDRPAKLLTKAAPILAVAVTVGLTWALQLNQQGVAVVGQVPASLPPIALPNMDLAVWRDLFVGALLISIVGFVESVSVGQTLAAKRRQRIDPDQELIGLGASNLAASVTGGMPVTGGFSRSVVNYDAGAETPAAGAFTAAGIALASLTLTPLIAYLPLATLAATIIVAVVTLIDLSAIRRTWAYSRNDFMAMLATILITLFYGVESGILAGVGLSLIIHLYRTSRPHTALVGRVPESEHFRNIERHRVEVDERLAILRIDESLYFANSRYLEDTVLELAANQPKLRHLVLACQAVNLVDASALDSLEAVNARLRDADVELHLSEVKGPVMDRLQNTAFLRNLSGEVYLSTFDAWYALHGARPAELSTPEVGKHAMPNRIIHHFSKS
ncbi:SulP family inorganic anion transporter [Modicisalibacter luteus]|uniref:SulP family inorganic anion transporter n=1 Tax=Modicisalibacter luteus TaxID=453962 RepID=A0ABV7M0Q6_9GAMM|nr:sulfate permease [Halomonas lutea]GHA91726.1 sodium-independent anion transporter [Halomonas lutea]